MTTMDILQWTTFTMDCNAMMYYNDYNGHTTIDYNDYKSKTRMIKMTKNDYNDAENND